MHLSLRKYNRSGLFCLQSWSPSIAQLHLQILIFLFFLPLLPEIFNWRRDLRTIKSTVNERQSQLTAKCSMKGKTFSSNQVTLMLLWADKNHSEMWTFPLPEAFTCSTSWEGCVDPFIIASILSILQLQAKAGFSRRRVGEKLRHISFASNKKSKHYIEPFTSDPHLLHRTLWGWEQ